MRKRTVIRKWRTIPQRGGFGTTPEGYPDYNNYVVHRESNAEQILEEAKKERDRWQSNYNRLARVNYELEFSYGIVRLVRVEAIEGSQLLNALKFRAY